MIDIFEGRLGGGKTYAAVMRIVSHLSRGGFVATNISLNWTAIEKYCADILGVIISPEQLLILESDKIGEFHKHTPSGEDDSLPVLVVVDEAHIWFNARDWSQTSKELLHFLTQSRKVVTDVIFISQSALNIDKQFMRLVQYIWRFRDMSRYRIPGLGIKWPLKQILFCQYDYDGRTLLQKEFRFKDKAIFALYQTKALLSGFPRLEGVITKFKLQKTKKKNKMKIVLILLAVVAGICLSIKPALLAFGWKREVPASHQAPGTPLASVTSPPIPANQSATSSLMPNPKPAYDIYTEEFLSTDGLTFLRTEAGEYNKGAMSCRGFVEAIQGSVARVKQPDGRYAYIVAQRLKPVPSPPPVEHTEAVAQAPSTPADRLDYAQSLIEAKRTDISDMK